MCDERRTVTIDEKRIWLFFYALLVSEILVFHLTYVSTFEYHESRKMIIYSSLFTISMFDSSERVIDTMKRDADCFENATQQSTMNKSGQIP